VSGAISPAPSAIRAASGPGIRFNRKNPLRCRKRTPYARRVASVDQLFRASVISET
jgi:hypothetical protein